MSGTEKNSGGPTPMPLDGQRLTTRARTSASNELAAFSSITLGHTTTNHLMRAIGSYSCPTPDNNTKVITAATKDLKDQLDEAVAGKTRALEAGSKKDRQIRSLQEEAVTKDNLIPTLVPPRITTRRSNSRRPWRTRTGHSGPARRRTKEAVAKDQLIKAHQTTIGDFSDKLTTLQGYEKDMPKLRAESNEGQKELRAERKNIKAFIDRLHTQTHPDNLKKLKQTPPFLSFTFVPAFFRPAQTLLSRPLYSISPQYTSPTRHIGVAKHPAVPRQKNVGVIVLSVVEANCNSAWTRGSLLGHGRHRINYLDFGPHRDMTIADDIDNAWLKKTYWPLLLVDMH
ncbi:hypothetical protein V8E36_005172 [Tilletia maclaganii]